MKRKMRIWLSLLLAVCMLAVAGGGACFADEEENPTPEPAPAAATEAEAPTKAPTDAPAEAPAATDEPDATGAPTDSPEATDAPEADPSPEASELPEASMMSLDEPMPIDLVDGAYQVDRDMTVTELLDVLGSVERIVILFGSSLSGDGTIALPVENNGRIKGGTFNGSVTNVGVIEGGTFNDSVTSSGRIEGGTFNRSVTNSGLIHQEKPSDPPLFNGDVTNNSTIEAGTFNGGVTNRSLTGERDCVISGGTFTAMSSVTNESSGTISGGTFNGNVTNERGGVIEKGTFVPKTNGKVTLINEGEISGGSFSGPDPNLEINNRGTISGGEFVLVTITNAASGRITNGSFFNDATPGQSSSVTNYGAVSGGTFMGVDNFGAISGGTFYGHVSNDFDWEDDEEGESSSSIGTITGGTFKCSFGDDKRVLNNSRIEGGTFECEVYNGTGGTIERGTFRGDVMNKATISGGTFAANVTNGDAQVANFDEDEDEPPREGKITGGTFEEGSTLTNNWNASGATVNGTVNAGFRSSMTGCTFGPNAKVGQREDESFIEVKYTANGVEMTADYGTPALSALNGEGVDPSKPWYWYDADDAACTPVKDADTFGLKALNYTQTPKIQPTDSPKPSATPRPSATPYSGGSGGSSGASTTDDGEEAGASAAETLAEEFLRDGDSDKLNIVCDDMDTDAGYELIYIPAEPDGREPEDGLIPGEVGMYGGVPGMLFVRAKGLGTEPRTLALTLSQIQRMREEQGVEALLFRNGAMTVSLGVEQLFEGKIPKLMELMRGGAEDGMGLAEYDVAGIDFDALDAAPEFSEEELREYRLELTVAPAAPVGYSIRAELALGEDSVEISLLLTDMGVTLHAPTVADNVAVYYMNEAQERFLLETHRGVVPGCEGELEGYDVTFQGAEATVMDLNRSATQDEFAGLCASTGEAGSYYIGVLPTAG